MFAVYTADHIILNLNHIKADYKRVNCGDYDYFDDNDWIEFVSNSNLSDSAMMNEWLKQGLSEHASIGTFAKFSLELMSIGAPLWIMELSNQASLDEIRHTQLSFDIAGMSELSTVVTALSNVGWTSGIHEFRIRAIKPGKDAIGITSSKDEIMAWVWIKQSRNYTHYYYGGGSISSSTNALNKYNAINADEWIWKKDDILTVKVDLIENKLSFYMNDNLMGDAVDIEANCTWYPIICVQENNTEYQLIR